MKLYDNARTVENESQLLADFQRRSQRCYQQNKHIANIQYAEQPRSTLDLFPCDAETTVIFIHGGYWQWCEKSDFAFIAPEILAQHCQCILLEYDLAPRSTLSQMVLQIQHALDFIEQQIWRTKHVILVGHSAGAHLAALHMSHPMVSQTILLSGIYDLAPIQNTHLNPALKLSSTDLQQFSPIHDQTKMRKPYKIVYGADELAELIEQSEDYFKVRQLIDQDRVSIECCSAVNHYSIVEHYFKTALSKHLRTL